MVEHRDNVGGIITVIGAITVRNICEQDLGIHKEEDILDKQ